MVSEAQDCCEKWWQSIAQWLESRQGDTGSNPVRLTMTLKKFIEENSGKSYNTPVFMMYYIVIDYDEYFDKILEDEEATPFSLRSKMITLERIENNNNVNRYYIPDDKLEKIYIECSQNGRLGIFDTSL